MILHYCVCEQCGQQTEINKENTTAFQTKLRIASLHKHEFNDNFFGDNFFASSRKDAYQLVVTNYFTASFCDKQCFVEYISEKMREDGMIRLTEEEIRTNEERQAKEMTKSYVAQGVLYGNKGK